ncbi:MAG: TonB-dependent receptor [Calditrichia bacterium]
MKPIGAAHIFFFIAFLVFLSTDVCAQNTGELAGKVVDVATNKGIDSVLVTVSGTEHFTYTDRNGEFLIRGVLPGEYAITLQAPGYGRVILLNVPVLAGEVLYKEVFLQRDQTEGENFYIGGIEVTAVRELLPERPATTTRISAGEIEHLQASSLGDVLELVPGQRFTNPGLEEVKQIRLRQTDTEDEANRNAVLGTQIIVDGVPVSNNANMQLDTKLNDGATYRITVNSGVDLRRIPAENIESVEVIRGIPPARYGDLSSGAIFVATTSGYAPYRVKYKYNPRNKELNFGGGYGWEHHQIHLNLNYAHSLRNIRIPGDSFTRLAGQLNTDSYFFQQKLHWENRLYYTRTFDEQDVREGDIFETERYNRDYTARWKSAFSYQWKKNQVLSALFSATLDRQDSYYKRIVSRDVGVISDRMTPGTQEGYFVSSYVTQLWVKGRAWNLFGRLEYASQSHTFGFLHDWQTGINITHEFNNGPGREFDPRLPPRSNANEGDRPRPYDDIPALTQLTFYLQDEIVGRIWRDFNLQLGLRYDLLDPTDWRWDRVSAGLFPVKSHFGNYLSPRINFVQYLSKNTQLRMGYGRTAKAPTLSMVYPNPVYFDVVDSMYYDPNNPENRFALVSTYIFDRTNENLKAFTQDKYELSIDRRIGNFGFSVSGFYEEMHDGFELSGFRPVAFTKYAYPHYPALQPAIPRDTVLLDYQVAINSVESLSKGIEFSFTSKKLPVINTTIRVDAAYHFTKSWWQNNHYEYASSLRYDPYLNENIRPFWKRTGSWSDNLIIHYRFDTMAKSLGLWFTLAIQQVAIERDRYTGLDDSLAVGYIREDGSTVFIPDAERGDEKYKGIRRVYAPYNYITESKPGAWLVNLRVSKSLWKGAEASFFVNNMFNSRPLYQRKRVPEGALSYVRRNPEIFYGLEFSMVVDDLYNFLKRY